MARRENARAKSAARGTARTPCWSIGSDACDLSVTFPLQAADASCGGAPPTVRWSAETFNRFKVAVSWDPAFASRTQLRSRTLGRTSWTIPANKWKKACAAASPSLYIRVLGRSTVSRTSKTSDTVTIQVK